MLLHHKEPLARKEAKSIKLIHFYFNFSFYSFYRYIGKAIIHTCTQYNTYYLRWIDNGYGSVNGDRAGQVSSKAFPTSKLYYYFIFFNY